MRTRLDTKEGMAEELGGRLLEAGLTTREALARALSEGPVSSGGLAARLHDAGLAEEDLVELFVAEGHGIVLDGEDLTMADPEITGRIPGSMAHALLALPLRLGGGDAVYVAMADPTDEDARKELGLALGGTVRPLLARIGALRATLERIYPDAVPVAEIPVALVRRRETLPPTNDGEVTLPGEPAPRSFGAPATGLSSSAPPSASAPAAELPNASSSPPASYGSSEGPRSVIPPHEASWSVEAGRRETPSYRSRRVSTGPAGRRRPRRRLPSRAHLVVVGHVLAAMRASDDRDEIVQLACEATLSVAETAVLLAARDDVLRGWRGVGPEVSPEAVRNLWIPRRSPSVFRDVLESGEPYAGPYGVTAADALYRAATGARGESCSVRPVRVGGRTVALLVADAPAHGALGLERIAVIAQALGECLRRVIAQARRRRTGETR
ncbi:MAG: hypothetical protein AAGH15_15865 [Myxococcota bacterium]